MPLEHSIQASVIKWINSQPNAIAENVSGNARQSGRADINACICGRCVKIEVKRPDTESNYETTEKQKLYLKRWKRAGAIAISVVSLSESKRMLKHLWEE